MASPDGVLRWEERWDDLLDDLDTDKARIVADTPARRFVASLVGEEFTEIGSLVREEGTSYEEMEDDGSLAPALPPAPGGGVVAGWGTIGDQRLFLAVDETAGEVPGRGRHGTLKARRIQELALRHGRPVVQVRAHDERLPERVVGGDFLLLDYGAELAVADRVRREIPFVSVIAGSISGPAALEALCGHMVVVVGDEALLSVEGRALAGSEIGAAGLADFVVEDLRDAAGVVRAFLSYLPGMQPYTRAADKGGTQPGNENVVADTISTIADPATLFDLKGQHAPEIRSALGRVGGSAIGIVGATGLVSEDGCRKATAAIETFDCMGVPILYLLDGAGVPLSDDGLRLHLAMLGCSTPSVSLFLSDATDSFPGEWTDISLAWESVSSACDLKIDPSHTREAVTATLRRIRPGSR